MSLISMHFGQAHVRLVQAGAALAAVTLMAGCGAGYRPVVTPVNPSGPAAQPSSLAVAISASSPTTAGTATIIDYSGDTIMAASSTSPTGRGGWPIAFTMDEAGATGYTLNSDSTISNFPISTTLQAKNVNFTTLPSTSQAVGMFSPSAGLWAANVSENGVDIFTGSPETFQRTVPVAPTPLMIVGPGVIGQRNYAISENNTSTPVGSIIPFGDMTCNTNPTAATQNGEADAIEVQNFTKSAELPLGKCPVYAIQSSDGRRLFVLNRGSDTVTVINSQNNTLDECTPFVSQQTGQLVTCHPTLPLSTTAVNTLNAANPGSGTPTNGAAGLVGMTAVAGPVYAEYNATTSQLVVANYDGGTVSVIDVSVDEFGNDSSTFGTTFTIPVGQNAAVAPNPASVTVLADGSNTPRAYVANQSEQAVAIVNLSSHTVEKWLPVDGHPRTVVSTANSLFGKVYAASPDSPFLTIIRTDQDIVDQNLLVTGGNILDVRVSTQNGSPGNVNNTTRMPGAGQPCYLPGAASTATLAACRTLPTATSAQ